MFKLERGSVSLLIGSRVIAACIPSLRPLTAVIQRGTHRAPPVAPKISKTAQATSSNASSRMIWPVRGNQDEANPAGPFTRLDDPNSTIDQERWGRNVKVQGGMNTGTDEDGIRLEASQ